MNSTRITWLVLLALALLGLRWWTWAASARSADADTVVQPVARALPRAPVPAAKPSTTVAATPADFTGGTREPEFGTPRDAFAVRKPPAPPAPPAAQQLAAVAAPKPFVGPLLPPPEPPPPPPPPPPFQVIGSWLDEAGPSVFLSGPKGVVHARVGDTLLGDYRIAQVTAQHVVLRHLSANRDASLAIPAGVQPALTTTPSR